MARVRFAPAGKAAARPEKLRFAGTAKPVKERSG